MITASEDGSFESLEQRATTMRPTPHSAATQPKKKAADRKKRGLKLLNKLNCLSPESHCATKHELMDDDPQEEQAVDSFLVRTARSSGDLPAHSSLSQEGPLPLQFISIESTSVYLQTDQDLNVVSAITWDSDGAHPMPPIVEERSDASQSTREAMLDKEPVARTIATSTSNPSTPKFASIFRQVSMSECSDDMDLYVSPCSDDVPMQSLSTEASRSIARTVQTLPESQLQLERILEDITSLAHQGDANAHDEALESFQYIQITTSPATPVRSNTQWAEKSLVRVQHRALSPLRPAMPPKEDYAKLIRRYEKLSQFLNGDEVSSMTSTIVTPVGGEGVEEEKEEVAQPPVFRAEPTFPTWAMPKHRADGHMSTSRQIQETKGDNHVVMPAVTWDEEQDEMPLKSPARAASIEEESPLKSPTRVASLEDETSTFCGDMPEMRKEHHIGIPRVGTWDDVLVQRERLRSSPSLDGSGSFGSASFSSLIVPVATRATGRLKQKPNTSTRLTSHPFFWRSHPRVTNTCYDTRDAKLVISRSRVVPFDRLGVIENLPERGWQTKTPASSIVALEPEDNDLDACMDAEEDFIVMNSPTYKPPLSPRKLSPERLRRFDPDYERGNAFFPKHQGGFPEIPPNSTKFLSGLDYQSDGDNWAYPWDTSQPQAMGEI
jgi:hypothetical protein